MSMYKNRTEDKKKAIDLRRNGWSISRICKELKVSCGSVSIWVKDIILSDDMKADILKHKNSVGIALMLKHSLKRKEDAKNIRLGYQEVGRHMAKYLGSDYSFGCALYLGEGTKSRNSCCMTNTDMELMRFFVGFLKKYFNVKNEDMRMSLLHYNNNNLSLSEVMNRWIKELDIDGCRIGKPTIKEGINGKNKHPYGVCAISISRTEIVQKIYGSIREYTNSNTIRFID